ncbi:MAG TPA: UvrD-helicase domain-containing protein [Alphaproteobacteria bacterium]|nr:UvrD-helicase domain-containing protein [Alphaproteobacteria bacterium]
MSNPFDLSGFDDEPTVNASVPAVPAPAPAQTPAQPLARAPAYLDSLNPEQRAAVESLDGPVLVLAGAGTGKTRVLVTRLAHLLATGRAMPGEVLAVTFTNKAAREMKERVGAMIGRGVEGMWLGTFHSISARIVRRHAELVGLKPDFTILDDDDQNRLLRQILQEANLDEKKWPPRALNAVIQRWKDRGLTPDKVPASDAGEFAHGRGVDLYRRYQERLRTLNAADFGDLLLHSLTIFTQHPDVLADYQRRFKYILVDEYQDTNVSQYLWLRLLAQARHNICCVGDDDQSIYGWRGAEVGNILRFEKDFPGAKVIRLERNYRSTSHILAAASGLIAHNADRLGKTLWTERAGGEKVRVQGVWDGDEEARVVSEEIESMRRHGAPLGQMAVLVRAGAQTRAFEERFITVGLPYRVVGGPRFYERQEIRDAIAYLRLVQRPEDDLAFERVINVPKRGLGDAALNSVHKLSQASGLSLAVAADRLLATDELKPRARAALGDFLASVARWRTEATRLPPAELAAVVLEESGYTAMWQDKWEREKLVDAPGRLENLKELVSALEEFETLTAFLEHVSLVMDADKGDEGDMVSLMTLHAAKGLEFDVVFLPGWEEGVFPHPRAMEGEGRAGLEEERRLAYVGLTRAKRKAHVLHAANRKLFSQWQTNVPSRFIEEIPVDNVDLIAGPGLYPGLQSREEGVSETADAFDFDARPRRPWREQYGSRSDNREGNGRYGESSNGGRDNGGRNGGGRFGKFAHTYNRWEKPAMKDVTPKKSASAGGTSTAGFRTGERIFHQKFGYGKITAVEGNKLEIAFEKAGAKKVLDNFVERA